MSNIPRHDRDSLPNIHVRSLGEFEYCPRAGVFAFDSQSREGIDEDSVKVPDLGYSPPFEIAIVEEQLAARLARLAKTTFLLAALVIFSALIGRAYGWFKTIPIWIANVPPLFVIMVACQDVAVLWRAKRRYQTAANPALLHEIRRVKLAVDWWQLIRVYSNINTGEHYTDPNLGLVGKPARILTFHNHRIPVILSGSARQDDVQSTHLLKLAAYCHLIRVVEPRTACDWGIVIFKDTRRGFAVPIDQVNIDSMRTKLRLFRDVLDRERHDDEKPAKGHPQACANCHLNRRRTYRKGKSETQIAGHKLLPYLHEESNTHCSCGDRFQWLPPVAFEESR